MEKELLSKEDAQKLLEKIQSDKDLTSIEEFIKNNFIEFEHNSNQYRVRLLSLKDKLLLHEFKLRKFGEYLQDKNILMEKDLIKIYKDRGIDIEAIDDSMKKLSAEIVDIQLKLGEALSKHETDAILNNYKSKIETLQAEKKIKFLQKTDLLSMSLENQLLNYEAEIITFLTLEISKDSKWERLFASYEDFINCEDEALINKAGTRSILLQTI